MGHGSENRGLFVYFFFWGGGGAAKISCRPSQETRGTPYHRK